MVAAVEAVGVVIVGMQQGGVLLPVLHVVGWD